MHTIGAEGVHGDGQRQRGINTSRQTHHDAGEAVFVDIVAHTEHQRAVNTRLVAQLRRDRPRLRHDLATTLPHEFDGVDTLLVSGRAHDDAAVGIHDEGVAFEYQLILPAHHVHVGKRQTDITCPDPRDVLALTLLVQFVWRGIDHDEKLGTVGAGELGRLRLPDVLADEHADPEALAVHYGGLRSRLEIALLVEHLVVGELRLAVDSGNDSPRNEGS